MKKFLIILALVLVMAAGVSVTVILSARNAKAIDFAIDKSAVSTEVKVGDNIDVTNLKAVVKFKNETEKELTAKDVEFYHGEDKLEGTVFEGLTGEVGEVEITVKYLTFTVALKVTVENLVAVSLDVDASAVPETKVGRAVDFSGVTATVTFDNESERSLTASDLSFYLGETKLTLGADGKVDGVTTEEGEVTVKAVYREAYAEFTVTVIPLDLDDLYYITEIAMPNNESARVKKATDTSATDEAKFFATEETIRLVGDDNKFVFVPAISAYYQSNDLPVDGFTCDTTAEITFGEEVLTKANENADAKTVEYYYNDELIVTLKYDAGEYYFTANAVNNVYTLSVLPLGIEYEDEPVELTVKVIDGYNVNDAKDLGIIDNFTSRSWTNENVWAGIREEKGWTLEKINATNAVILQRDIKVTYADLPEEYFATIKGELTYYNFGDYETPVETGISNKRLTHDGDSQMRIYERETTHDFAIYGNFYSIDLSEFPLASAFDYSESQTEEGRAISGYRSDYSNATFIRMRNTATDDKVKLNISNIDVMGNANIDQYQIFAPGDTDKTDPMPVNAGGLIFLKAHENCEINIENAIMKTMFITLFPEYGGTINADKVKIYDSYQNAGFMFAKTEMNISNSDIKRAGGPLFIMQHEKPSDAGAADRIPMLYITDSVVENFVTGGELWFDSMKAQTAVGNLRDAMNLFLTKGNTGKIVTQNSGNKENCINLICALMANVTSAGDLQNPAVQGYCEINSDGKKYILNRMSSNAYLMGVVAQGAPAFNADNSGFYYLDAGYNAHYQFIEGTQTDTDIAIATGKYLAFNNGGLGVIVETFPVA